MINLEFNCIKHYGPNYQFFGRYVQIKLLQLNS